MFSPTKLSVLFAFALSVSALATPHVARSPHGHHAIAARMAAPAPAVGLYGDEVKVVKPKKMRKRGDTGRCKAKSSSSSAAPSSTASPEPTTPVANVAASPSSSSTPPPQTSSSKKAKSSSTQAPAPQTTSNNSGSSNSGSGSSNSNTPSFLQGTQTGEITFYGIGLGACGVTNSGSDRIAAVSKLLFDSFPNYDGVNPNNNPVCGKSVTITYKGKSTTVTIEDRCEACAITDLDLSPTSFQDLAAESVGRLDGATWVWND